jgi:hypothetical protein
MISNLIITMLTSRRGYAPYLVGLSPEGPYLGFQYLGSTSPEIAIVDHILLYHQIIFLKSPHQGSV